MQPIAGMEVPCWDHLLIAAMKLAEGLGMGYLGVDFVLDVAMGRWCWRPTPGRA